MALQPEPVVTGDAVILDVQIAQVPVRALSALIDMTMMSVGYLIGVLLWAATLRQFDPALSGAVLVIFTVLVLIGYPVGFETATRGRSLGKMALGLRVVSEDGGPERFRQALFRALAGVVELWMFAGGPAVICSLISPKGKRIGDVFGWLRRRPCRRSWRGGPPRCSSRGWAPTRPNGPASSCLGRRSWTLGSATRWRIGSRARWWPGSRRHHRRGRRRSWCWPRCWPSGTGGSWHGCGHRRHRSRRPRRSHPQRRDFRRHLRRRPRRRQWAADSHRPPKSDMEHSRSKMVHF
jgi:uncharacterized RDD family membrane protein YckC